MKKSRIILLALLVIFALMQFYRIDKSRPETDPQKDLIAITNPPAEIAAIFKNSCYDCHSYETKYPWYTNIAPVSISIAGHIRNGRNNVNYSIWGDYDANKQRHKLEEIIEVVLEEKTMPPKGYSRMHSEAPLTEEQRQQFADWVKSQLN